MGAFTLKYLIRNLNLINSLLEIYTGDPRQWRNMCQHFKLNSVKLIDLLKIHMNFTFNTFLKMLQANDLPENYKTNSHKCKFKHSN